MGAANRLVTVILEVGMHCESCASDTISHARCLKGVKTVSVDLDKNQLTILGEVNPLKIQDELRRKIKKKVELVFPLPDKAAITTSTSTADNKNGKESEREEESLAADKVSQAENEDAATNNNTKPQEALATTTKVVLGLKHCCQGCSPKIRKIVSDTYGVRDMELDVEKELVTIKGSMDVKLLIDDLREKLNRDVRLITHTDEVYSNSDDKESENVSSNNAVKKKGSSEDNGSNETEMAKSVMELKPEKVQKTIAVFKVPLHCEGCIKRIKKIIRRIIGVHEVRVNKEQETVTVIGTFDVISLTETMKKRLKKLVEEKKIEIKKEAEVTKSTSHYLFEKKATKQESSSPPALQLSVQEPEFVRVVSSHNISEETSNQNQSPRSKLDSETGGNLSATETADWGFLITGLIVEGVSAVLDQLGYLLASMVLAFVALLLCAIELFVMARREGNVAFDRTSDLPCFYCHSTNKSPTSELLWIVHGFGLTCAVWQCLYSTVQYIYALRNLHNPINLTPLPFIFLSCVLISKLIRKLEESNCQNLTDARVHIESPSCRGQFGDVISLPVEHDQGYGSRRWMQQNGQTMDSSQPNGHVETASEPVDTIVSSLEYRSGDFGCSHYRRRCSFKAPCCNKIFYCWICHDDAKNSKKTSCHDQHHIRFHEVMKVICSLCNKEQDVQQNCINCRVYMGKYFCSKCKIYDDDVSKHQYHCDECRICRDGGRENFFHCKKCGSCYPKLTEAAHQCMEKDKQKNESSQEQAF